MGVCWLWTLAALVIVCASADRGGSSLRGALEALQRRQRGRAHSTLPPQPDYDSLYEFIPPQGYPEPDYITDLDEVNVETPKYFVKLLQDKERPMEAYDYKVIKKNNNAHSKESAFRERSHMNENARLQDLFADRKDNEDNELVMQRGENDAEYALLLGQLWSKYRNNKHPETSPQGVVKLYKDKVVKKRYSNNWGPIAFKKKRSSGSEIDKIPAEYDQEDQRHAADPNYNRYDVTDDDRDDIQEEYAIAFQPLDGDNPVDLDEDAQYSYNTMEKRFPVSKRSSGPYHLTKRLTQDHKSVSSKRSSAGTDPQIVKHLSKIFGDLETIKAPVKRSSDSHDHNHDHHDHDHNHDHHDHDHYDHDHHIHDDHVHEYHDQDSHEIKPPYVAVHKNHTHENNETTTENEHTEHMHLHHPGTTGKEIEKSRHDHDTSHSIHEKPIHVKKKSIDWSDYFGIDKRIEKSRKIDMNQNKLRNQYFNTFNKEVLYPLNSFGQHSTVKRNFIKSKPHEETDTNINNEKVLSVQNEKRGSESNSESKLDNIDKKLRNMEGMIVDEALHYSNIGEELDSKEEQEMKEKLLSRLAAAYSLEKMRKALKEFKQSLQIQKIDSTSKISTEEPKEKRLSIKKENADSNDIPLFNKAEDNDFEEELGAGHYLNGKHNNQFAEGYMGGSGRHSGPVMSTAVAPDSCPVLTKIIQRCQSVDLLAGDRGQLFLPLCSLHQICYICGDAPPTTCDLVFLSEADTICEGDMGCQRAARAALMALRELHDTLADDLEGECEASPCLPATLRLNNGWPRALQR